MYKKFPTTDFIRPKDIKSSISNKEQKYFIAYVAYGKLCDNSLYRDIFNEIIFINEEITSAVISDIQKSLINKLNDTSYATKYYAAQIVNIVKL